MKLSRTSAPSPRGIIELFTITNEAGASVTLSTFGAGITSIRVPDARGEIADVALGYKNPADYINDGPCFGKIPGRYANRIGGGSFTLDGKTYHLPLNSGPNSLHGGFTGFQNHQWKPRVVADNAVEFTYFSADGEEHYPGNLTVTALYEFSEDCELRLTLKAETDAPTVINLTNHSYFNLDGESSGKIFGHELKLDAASFLLSDETLVPTGEIDPVEGTPMDFLEFKALGKDLKADFMPLKIARGYDHCFVTRDCLSGRLRPVAWLRSPRSRRLLTVSTTQPGVQIYTGNWLSGCADGISGRPYENYDGVAIECQHYPDSPNQPQFPSTVLRPGEEFSQIIIFSFSTY